MNIDWPFIKQEAGALLKRTWWPLLLEAFMRFARLPLFPGWGPLFKAGSTEHPRRHLIAGWILVVTLDVLFFGPGAIDFGLAVLAGVLVLRRPGVDARAAWRKFFVFCGTALAAWTGIGLITNRFPVGALDIEIFLSAIFARLVGSDFVAGLISRFLLLALVYVSSGIASGSSGWLAPRVRRFIGRVKDTRSANSAAMVLLTFLLLLSSIIVSGCGDPSKEYFQPAGDSDDTVRYDFADGRSPALPVETKAAGSHPVLPGDARGNAVCLGCHANKIESDAPLREKGLHEIHFKLAKIEQDCVFCHENAGKPDFVSEYPGLGRRYDYNGRCAGCHARQGGARLYWNRKYR